MDEWYALKRSSFLGKDVVYICQNINGPCPLLAVANVLLLRGHLSLKELTTDGDFVSARDLLAIVHRRIVDTNPPLTNGTELERLTQEKTLKDVRQLLPSMFVGLDVNVRFHNITDFEYTVACAVFDMLDIQLVHGWLIDQQDTATLRVVGNKSYNELIERLVDYRGVLMTEETEGKEAPTSATTGSETSGSSPDSGPSFSAIAIEQAPPSTIPVETLEFHGAGVAGLTIDVTQPLSNSTPGGSPSSTPKKSPSQKTVETLVRERHLSDADAVDTATTLLEEGPILEEFFNSTASQLTYYGLVKLHEDIRERQLCVFFRNNHFSTLFKYEGALYLLATDAGYLDEPSIVWERLNEIDGDTEYVDANFRRVGSSERQQTLYSHRQDDPLINSSDQQFQALGAADGDGANIPDESSREVSSASDNDYHSTSDGQDETRAAQHSADQSHRDSKQNLDPDYLLALRLQEEEEAHAQRAKGGTIVNIAPRSLQPIGADRDGGSANISENDESYTGLRETSEDEYVPVIVDGEVIVSAEEMEAQRKAALYYAQQKRQLDAQTAQLQQQHQAVQQQQQPQQPQPNQGRFRGMRRSIAGESTGGDCCIS